MKSLWQAVDEAALGLLVLAGGFAVIIFGVPIVAELVMEMMER